MNKLRNNIGLIEQIFPRYLVLLVLAPILVGYIIDHELVPPLSIVINMMWIMVFTIPYSLFQKRIIYKIAVIFYFIIGFIEICHWIILKGPLTITSLLVMSNTNHEEAMDFLDLKAGSGLLVLILYSVLFIYALRNSPKYYNSKNRYYFLVGVALFFCSSFLYVVQAEGRHRYVPQTVKVAYSFVNELNQYKRSLEENRLRIVEAKSISHNDQETFVLIIGESCSKNHMSLYGAARKTNPKLESRDDLIVYSNVVSGYSTTMNCIPSILSQSNLENKMKFAKSVDLLDIFRAAGFKTYWISNQSPIGIWDNRITAIAKKSHYSKFVNISSNTSVEAILNRSYDSKLFRPFASVLKENVAKKFIVLHLMGSHSTYSKRYPSNFSHFKGESSKEKIISEYYNSLLYNDYVVDSLLNILSQDVSKRNSVAAAIYLSDHGENLYDEQDRVGHDFSKVMPKANVEIPFVIWLSPTFLKENQDKVTTIRNHKKKPFVTDDLFHSILDVNYIQSPYFEEERSVFNKNFNDKRRRILVDGKDYDEK